MGELFIFQKPFCFNILRGKKSLLSNCFLNFKSQVIFGLLESSCDIEFHNLILSAVVFASFRIYFL